MLIQILEYLIQKRYWKSIFFILINIYSYFVCNFIYYIPIYLLIKYELFVYSH